MFFKTLHTICFPVQLVFLAACMLFLTKTEYHLINITRLGATGAAVEKLTSSPQVSNNKG